MEKNKYPLRKRSWLAPLVLLMLSVCSPTAHAAGILDFNLIDPNELNQLIPQNVADEAAKLYAIYSAHRPYSGATSIAASNGFDLLVETTLVKIGDGLLDALAANGVNTSDNVLPAVPVAKLSIRKAFGRGFDLGMSGLFYRGNMILGGDLKFVLHEPTEGPTYALRLGYNYTNVPYAYVKSMSTFSPEFVVSRKLRFAEPYIGIGGRYFTGKIEIPFQLPIGPAQTVSKTGSGTTAYAFTGIYFRILGANGLRLGMEGSYDISGYHTVGTVFGFGL